VDTFINSVEQGRARPPRNYATVIGEGPPEAVAATHSRGRPPHVIDSFRICPLREVARFGWNCMPGRPHAGTFRHFRFSNGGTEAIEF